MYTEYSPYSYCNNSPMMWRDPSGLGMEMEIVDKCAVVANSLIDFWGDIPDNCVLPNKKRTGIDDGQGGSNGYSRSIISKSKNASNQFTADNGGGSSTLVDFGSNGDNMPGGGGGGAGVNQNSLNVYAPLKNIPGHHISFSNSYLFGNYLYDAYTYSASTGNESGYSIFYHPEYGYRFSKMVKGSPNNMPPFFDTEALSNEMYSKGWLVVGTVHTHTSGKAFSDADIGAIHQDYSDPELTKKIINDKPSFHIVETADYRYVIVVTDTKKLYNWGWYIRKKGAMRFEKGAILDGFSLYRNESIKAYHERLRKWLKKYDNGIFYFRIKK